MLSMYIVQCDACLITTWRLGLQAPLVTRNNSYLLLVFSSALHFLQSALIKEKENNKNKNHETIAWLMYSHNLWNEKFPMDPKKFPSYPSIIIEIWGTTVPLPTNAMYQDFLEVSPH